MFILRIEARRPLDLGGAIRYPIQHLRFLRAVTGPAMDHHNFLRGLEVGMISSSGSWNDVAVLVETARADGTTAVREVIWKTMVGFFFKSGGEILDTRNVVGIVWFIVYRPCIPVPPCLEL